MPGSPRLLPPPGFVPAVGVIQAALVSGPYRPDTLSEAVAKRFARGLRYERAVRSGLAAWAATNVVSLDLGPWFRFRETASGSGWRFCQPDAILDFGSGSPLVVLEAKLTFEPRAWWQLSALYRPVVEAALGRPVLLGAVCGSFDPAVRARIPATVVLALEDAGEWLAARRSPLAALPEPLLLPVLQWRKPGAGTLSA